jgi:hypothetical protein
LKPAFPAPKAPVFEDNFNLRKYEVYSTDAIINIDFNPINIGVAPTTPVSLLRNSRVKALPLRTLPP